MKKFVQLVFTVLLTLSLYGCKSNYQTADTVKEKSGSEISNVNKTENFVWEYASAEETGVDEKVIEEMFAGFGDGVLSSVVVKDGKIIGEYFADGYDEDSVFSMQSVSKSITGTLVGIAIDEGYIKSVDDYVADYLPLLNEEKYKDKQSITIRQLLDHTSGLVSTDSSLWVDWRSSSDWITYLLDRPLEHEPGTYFEYSTGNTHLLSAVLEEVTGLNLMDYADKVLFKPLGIRSATMDNIAETIYVKDTSSLVDSSSFYTDPSGVSDGGNGFSLSALDMARIGLLYSHNGEWQGKQLVSSQYIEDATSLQIRRNSDGSGYGYCWWTGRSFGTKKYNGYFAQGYYGQFIFVVPDIDLVVVFTSHAEHVKALDYQSYVSMIVNGCNQ